MATSDGSSSSSSHSVHVHGDHVDPSTESTGNYAQKVADGKVNQEDERQQDDDNQSDPVEDITTTPVSGEESIAATTEAAEISEAEAAAEISEATTTTATGTTATTTITTTPERTTSPLLPEEEIDVIGPIRDSVSSQDVIAIVGEESGSESLSVDRSEVPPQQIIIDDACVTTLAPGVSAMSMPTPRGEPVPTVEFHRSLSEADAASPTVDVSSTPNQEDLTLQEFLSSPHGNNQIVERSPGGRYVRFSERLGSGASKDVYRAYDTEEGIEVAWNVVHLAGVPKNERNRIVNEVRLLERLHHQNIISFHGSWVNRERQQVNFVTEILSSGTLKSFINKVQVIRWKIAKRWAVQILKGLEYLHSQDPPVIHRDLKCENIFINGTSGDLRIGDLGLSTVNRNGKVLSVLGTPEFMAPDMYEENPYDEKVDIYAFGMCLLEIFTKEIPYNECSNPAQIYKKVTRGAPPDSLARLKSKHAREFIELCLGSRKEDGTFVRPSATELLAHPFLIKRPVDDDEVEVEPRMQEQTIREASGSKENPSDISAAVPTKNPSSATTAGSNVVSAMNEESPKARTQTVRTNSLDESDRFDEMPESETNSIRKVKVMMGRGEELKDDDEAKPEDHAVPASDVDNEPSGHIVSNNESIGKLQYLVAAAVIEETEVETTDQPYADDILKLVVTLPVEGETQNVQFDFDLVVDDPIQVTKEMVAELGIPQGAVLEISETISSLAQSARTKKHKYLAGQAQQAAGHARTLSQNLGSMPLQQPVGLVPSGNQPVQGLVPSQHHAPPPPQMPSPPQQMLQQPQMSQQEQHQQVPQQQPDSLPPQQMQLPLQHPITPQPQQQQQQMTQQQPIAQHQQQQRQPLHQTDPITVPLHQPQQIPSLPQQQTAPQPVHQQQIPGPPPPQQQMIAPPQQQQMVAPPQQQHMPQTPLQQLMPAPTLQHHVLQPSLQQQVQQPPMQQQMQQLPMQQQMAAPVQQHQQQMTAAPPQEPTPAPRQQLTAMQREGSQRLMDQPRIPSHDQSAQMHGQQNLESATVPSLQQANVLVQGSDVGTHTQSQAPYAQPTIQVNVQPQTSNHSHPQRQGVQMNGEYHRAPVSIESKMHQPPAPYSQLVAHPPSGPTRSQSITGSQPVSIRNSNRGISEPQLQAASVGFTQSSQSHIQGQALQQTLPAPSQGQHGGNGGGQLVSGTYQTIQPDSQVQHFSQGPVHATQQVVSGQQTIPPSHQMHQHMSGGPHHGSGIGFGQNLQHQQIVGQIPMEPMHQQRIGQQRALVPTHQQEHRNQHHVPSQQTPGPPQQQHQQASAYIETRAHDSLQKQPHQQPTLQNVQPTGCQQAPISNQVSQGQQTVLAAGHSNIQQGQKQRQIAGELAPVPQNIAMPLTTNSEANSSMSIGSTTTTTNSVASERRQSDPLTLDSLFDPSGALGELTMNSNGDESVDEMCAEELRKLDEDYQKNLMRAKKVFASRMDNLVRTQHQREAQHQKTLEQHQKDRAAFEKRLQQEEIEQNRRIEQMQKEWDRRREEARLKQLEEENSAIASGPGGLVTGSTSTGKISSTTANSIPPSVANPNSSSTPATDGGGS